LISLTSISLIPCASVSKSPWSTWPWWGIFHQIREKATRQQSTVIKTYGILAIMVLLRLAPLDCWLVVVLGQNERCHGRSDAPRFCFCCSMHDARARKRFLIDLRAIFLRKGAPTLDLENYCLYLFLHEYIN
jgi:hypothetical protein